MSPTPPPDPDARQPANVPDASPPQITDPAASFTAALDAHRAGHLDAAQSRYMALVAADATHAAALHYWGVARHQLGDHRGALLLMDRALAHAGGDAICWSNRALAAHALGDSAEALRSLREALRLDPSLAEAHSHLALVLRDRGDQQDLAAAVEHGRAALALAPDYVDAHVNLGSALAALGHHDEAIASYRAALALTPDDAGIHFNLANALNALGDEPAAIAGYLRALELHPAYAAAWVNLGTLLGGTGDYRSAEKCYRHAVALEPNPANLVCLGAALGAQGRNDEEEPYYLRALALDPEHANAQQNLVWLKLKRGQYREGWAAYARRWRAADYAPFDVDGMPEWRGEPLAGKRVLLVHEQGFGDQIQFVRYAAEIAARGASVDVCVPRALLWLAQSAPGVHRAWSGTPSGGYDFWIYMMSVPPVVGTTLDTIPATVPYLFARKTEVAAWRARVQAAMQADLARRAGKSLSTAKAGQAATARKPAGHRCVGLVWAGNPGFYNDRNRSLPLAALRDWFALAHVSWFSLQKGEAARAQLSALADPANAADSASNTVIHDFSDDLHDFADTAALIMNLDLVIAVDTSVAHLAGALGKPVWVLVPANGEWRWLEHRADSPWYPTARLFRQREVGDWREAIDEVREALAAAPSRVRAKSRPVARKLETAEKESAVTPQPQAERKPGHKPARKRARVRAVAGESTANTASGDLVDQMDNPAVPPTLTPDPP
ncbi:tetratricopeptide repeat-containing glycosyltransferase family protein [Paraburkholderia tropica]|uniref:tetratricopeptide repeat-containing glycosyltransferase family protein n=1 Tax=Paraburkholderia tropica TaxID=92647 RepID=UPI002ABD5809|nr:tetratricopeptide repeat-containing glycosyltransferase family protein [Paraburkholderia tropica]